MTRILTAGRLLPYLRNALEERFDVTPLPEDPVPWLREHGDKFRGIATTNAVGLPADWLPLLPKLEIISSFGVGMDSLPLDEAAERGIVVGNTPDVLNDDTANMGIALLLAVTRNMVANDAYVRAGRWGRDSPPPLGTGLAGKTAGILGMGRIGLSVATKLQAFGCKLAYHNRSRREDVAFDYLESPAALAQASDFLIATLPGGTGTKALVDAGVLEALGPEGVFINIARGSVVDQEALISALQSGTIKAAGLDVFADEPNVPEALIALPNVTLQPHQASATRETRERMADVVVKHLVDHFG